MIGIYTALFGKYDQPKPAPWPDSFLFTDQKVKAEGWQIVNVNPPHTDVRYASRYYFDQSCLVMPDYEYTIMHGGNAQLKLSPEEMIKFLPPDVDMACCKHHHRSTVWQEAEAVIRMHKDTRDKVEPQMDRYRAEGFPGDDLSACIILVRRNTPRMAEFETMWWNEVKNGSVRDQLSFDYCLWKLKFQVVKLPGTWHNYLNLQKHANGKNYEDQR